MSLRAVDVLPLLDLIGLDRRELDGRRLLPGD